MVHYHNLGTWVFFSINRQLQQLHLPQIFLNHMFMGALQTDHIRTSYHYDGPMGIQLYPKHRHKKFKSQMAIDLTIQIFASDYK